MDEQFGQHFIDLLVDKKLYIFKMHIKFSLHSPKNVHAYVYKHHSKSGRLYYPVISDVKNLYITILFFIFKTKKRGIILQRSDMD